MEEKAQNETRSDKGIGSPSSTHRQMETRPIEPSVRKAGLGKTGKSYKLRCELDNLREEALASGEWLTPAAQRSLAIVRDELARITTSRVSSHPRRKHHVDDAVQMTLASLRKVFPGLKHPQALCSYACKMTIRGARHSQNKDRCPQTLERSDEPPAESWTPCDYAQESEFKDQVLRALDHLPSQYRRVIELSLLHPGDIVAIAAALELSTQNAHQRLSRARKALGKVLGIAPAPNRGKSAARNNVGIALSS